MKLKIVRIVDRGIPNKERLHLSVVAQANLSFYVVIGTTKISPTAVLTAAKYFHWWSNYPVNAGDSITLYTGSGVPSKNVRLGGTDHFFYWGLPNVIWAEPNSCAVVLELENWETSL